MTPITLALGLLCAAPSDEAARIVEQAIQAHSGPEDGNALVKIARSVTYHEKGTESFTAELNLGPLGRLRVTQGEKGAVDYTARRVTVYGDHGRQWEETTVGQGAAAVRTVLVADGKNSWMSADGKVRALSAAELRDLDDANYVPEVCRLKCLRDRARFRLEVVAGATVGDEACAGVRVSSRGRNDIILYFGEKSHLLLKGVWRGRAIDDREREVVEIVSDYKKFGGLPVPMRLRTTVDGDFSVEEQCIESVEFVSAEVAGKLFKKP